MKFFKRCSVLCIGSTDVDFCFFFLFCFVGLQGYYFIFKDTTEELKIDLSIKII